MATQTRGGNGKFRRSTETAARDARAAELHGQGWTYERIAAELGFASKGHAHNAVQRAYDAIDLEGVERAKKADLERLDRLIEQAWAVMLRPHFAVSNGRVVRRFVDVERDEDGIERLDADGKEIPVFEDVMDDAPILAAVAHIRALLERRARIYGYDAPTRARVEVIPAETVEAQISALEAELARNDPAPDRSPA